MPLLYRFILLSKVLLRQSAAKRYRTVLKAALTVLLSSLVGAVSSWLGVKKLAEHKLVLEIAIDKCCF